MNIFIQFDSSQFFYWVVEDLVSDVLRVLHKYLEKYTKLKFIQLDFNFEADKFCSVHFKRATLRYSGPLYNPRGMYHHRHSNITQKPTTPSFLHHPHS